MTTDVSHAITNVQTFTLLTMKWRRLTEPLSFQPTIKVVYTNR